MTLYGWDASDYDWSRGPMDLVAAKNAGVSFFTYKATEGTSIKHAHYGESMSRARSAGIEFLGAYIVPRTAPTVDAQVSYFLDYVNAATPWWTSMPGFFFQVDTEIWSNNNGVYDHVSPARGADVAAGIRARTNRQVVHYAPKWAYGDTIPGNDPLWASDYGTNSKGTLQQTYPGDSSPKWGAYSGRTPVFLQHGSNVVIGTNYPADGNAFRGTVEDLRKFIVGTPIEQPQEDDPMHMVTAGRAYQGGPGTIYAIYPDHVEDNKMLAVPMSNYDRVTQWQASGVRMVEMGMTALDPRFFNIAATDAYPAPGGAPGPKGDKGDAAVLADGTTLVVQQQP